MRKSPKKEINQFKVIEYTEGAKESLNRHVKLFTMIFSFFLIFIFFHIYSALFIQPTKSVMVESGKLNESGNFEALVVRSEENVYARQDGVLDIFLTSGTTAKKGETVCSITHDLTQREQILSNLSNEKARLTSTVDYDRQSQKKMQTFFREYASNLNFHDFDLSNQVQLELENMLNNGAVQYTVQDVSTYQKVMDNVDLYKQQIESIGNTYTVENSFTISYTSDGMEDISLEKFVPDDLNRRPQFVNRLENRQVKAKDFLFRKVDNLYYYFIAEVDGIAYNFLENKVGSFVSLFFPNKNLSMTVKVEKLEPHGGKYIVTFLADRFINRFLDDRFVSVQISYNQYDGLKVPNSAIDTKYVIVVPKGAIDIDYKGNYFVRHKVKDEKGKEKTTQLTIKIYGQDEEQNYYILPVDDDHALEIDDILMNKIDDTEQLEEYVISNTTKIWGVYVLNKGYTDFKQVQILYQSDNFSIVQKYFPYSIKIYDQIASEAHNVKEFSVIK